MNAKLREMIERYFTSGLSPVELEELEAHLLVDQDLCREFAEMGHQEGLLREWGGAQHSGTRYQEISRIGQQATRRHARRRALKWLGAAACLILTSWLVFGGRSLHDRTAGAGPVPAPGPPEAGFYQGSDPLATSQAVASLHDGNLVTDGGQPAGETLTPGAYLLPTGTASLDTLDGTRVCCMAPARLEISPARSLVLDEGVFLIRNQSLPISLGIDAGGIPLRLEKGECVIRLLHSACEVLLISGKLIHGDGSLLIETGKALMLNRDGVAKAMESTVLLGFSNLLKGSPSLRKGVTPAPNPFADDPSLIISYDFEDEEGDGRLVTNRASASADAQHRNGLIIGAARVSDRRRPGRVMEFSHHTDRIRVPVDLESKAVTFSVRLCVAGLDRRYNSIFMADDFRPGALHWQLGNTGYLGVGTHSDIYHDVDSPPVLGPVNIGEWHHMATTCDASTGTVVHYLDGEVIKQGNFGHAFPFRIGMAELGNWRPAGLDGVEFHLIRNFIGKMDDFQLFNRVLSPEEIRKLAEGQ